MWNQAVNTPNLAPLLQWQGLQILPGLNAVTGDEGRGKTRLLRELAHSTPDALWLDLRLPDDDALRPEEVWARLRAACPNWQEGLASDLAQALDLSRHLHKQLFMLSTGSRRKVALVGLLSSGQRITCLDQPYVSLDMHSMGVLRDFLQDMADHTARAWVVADYEADASLAWRSTLSLDGPLPPSAHH